MKTFFKHFIVLLLFITIIFQASAQSITPASENDNSKLKVYFGFGMGMDYGGLGMKAELLPSKYIGLFAGGGYNLLEPAFNVGVSAKLLPDKKFQPTLTAMYGYNAVIIIKDRRDYSDSYYGFTFGAGGELKYGVNGNKFSFAILVPCRNEEFNNHYNELKNWGVEYEQEKLPIAVSFGMNFLLKNKSKKL